MTSRSWYVTSDIIENSSVVEFLATFTLVTILILNS